MTINEAMEKFGLSYKCIQNRIHAGKIHGCEKRHDENGHLVWMLPDDCVLAKSARNFKTPKERGMVFRSNRVETPKNLSHLSYEEKRQYVWRHSISMPIGNIKQNLGLTTKQVIALYDSFF